MINPYKSKFDWPALALCFAISINQCLPCLPGVAAGYFDEQSVYALCEQSDRLKNASQYTQAIEVLEKAAKYDPTSYSAYVHCSMSICYRRLKKYDAAVREGQAALKYDANNASALYAIAATYYDMDHYDTSNTYLKKLLSTNSDPTWQARANDMIADMEVYARIHKAEEYSKKGQFSAAARILEQAVNLKMDKKKNAYIHSSLCFMYERTGKPQKAIDEGKVALSIDPDKVNCLYTMACAYADLGDFDSAIGWLKRYLERETDAQERKKAADWMNDLSDDRKLVDMSTANLPDYYDQMMPLDDRERWEKSRLPLKVYLVPAGNTRGYKPEYAKFALHAFDTWCEATGKRLSYKVIDKPQDADITVRFTDSLLKTNDKGRERVKAGITYSKNRGGHRESAEVVVCTVNSFDANNLLEDGECASTCIHEIGHALGMGHSPSVKDIMYFSSSVMQDGGATKRDKATLAKMYADYPVTAFVPTTKLQEPIKYLPPPAFVLPKPPDTSELIPPLFVPPPFKPDEEKLPPPPLFTPPPISGENKKQKKDAAPPLFTPPPPK